MYGQIHVTGNWAAIRRAVVYYVQAAHAFSAGIKCRDSTSIAREVDYLRDMQPSLIAPIPVRHWCYMTGNGH